MKRALYLATKDLRLLMRDKAALFWVLVFPLLIAILFGSIFGGSNGASRIEVAMVDQDRSNESAGLVAELKNSTALNINDPKLDTTLEQAKDTVRKGELTGYILIPKGFGKEVETFEYSSGPPLAIGIDPSRQAESGMLQGILAQAAYKEMTGAMQRATTDPKYIGQADSSIKSSTLTTPEKSSLLNLLKAVRQYESVAGSKNSGSAGVVEMSGPRLETQTIAAGDVQPKTSFEVTFPQAIIWGLLGVISSFAISFVKEREQGTLVRLKASPMSLTEILLGKGLACFLAAFGVMALLLVVGHFLFGVRLISPGLLALAMACGAICIVGIMMLLSVLGKTEQAVAGSSWGVMIIMAMFGGGMIPIFMMPPWMRAIGNISPLKWTTLSIEGAIWRGFSLQEMAVPCLILLGIGVFAFAGGAQVLKARS